MSDASRDEGSRVGRYRLLEVIARGGMAQVHLALADEGGPPRVVAVKRLHAHLVRDRELVAMFRDEARIVAHIRHPNVIRVLDIVSLPDELFLVMEYVSGESLSRLLGSCSRAGTRAPPEIVVAVVCDALAGLHAAHEARNVRDAPLGIVHRDVSPQNILVGDDGRARVLDFGIAYAVERLQPTTLKGLGLKGKLEYMAPEQLTGERVDRRADVHAAGIVLWEGLTGLRLFKADNEAHTMCLVQTGARIPPSQIVPELPAALDGAVLRALSPKRDERQATAADLAAELERALVPAPRARVARWVADNASESLAMRRARVREIEAG